MSEQNKFAWMVKNNTPQEQLVHIFIDKLVPNPQNHIYDMSNIDGLAHSIEVTQSITPLTVIPIVGTDQYKILEGHRRCEAIKKLIEAGKRTNKKVPCIIRRNLSERDEILQLINSNRQQRERSVFEKMHEIEILEPLAREDYEKITDKTKGSFRAFFAKWLGDKDMSESSLQRLLSLKNLIIPLGILIDKQELPLTAASYISGKDSAAQYIFYQAYQQGKVTLRLADIKYYFMSKEKQEKDVQVEHDSIKEYISENDEIQKGINEEANQGEAFQADAEDDAHEDLLSSSEQDEEKQDNQEETVQYPAEEKANDEQVDLYGRENTEKQENTKYINDTSDNKCNSVPEEIEKEIPQSEETFKKDVQFEHLSEKKIHIQDKTSQSTPNCKEIKWLINALTNNIGIMLTEKIELEIKYDNKEQEMFYKGVQQRLTTIINSLQDELRN